MWRLCGGYVEAMWRLCGGYVEGILGILVFREGIGGLYRVVYKIEVVIC
jgi:hypothetical protein